MKSLMTGNEALARGAYEAGTHFASAYPGTPSTEILENLARYKEVYSEWAPNEKVGMEAASGASIMGARALTTMKHVGLNVAADPFFTMAYIGVNGGLVIINADDPGMHSSQNEQDNRYYALHAKVPMLEPSDSEECRIFVKKAYEISEEFDTPVLIRTTTRVNHSKSLVNLENRKEVAIREYRKDKLKTVMTPGHAQRRHPIVEERLVSLRQYNNASSLNIMEKNTKKLGIITSGISYAYAKEVFGDHASYLKLGMTFPIPAELIEEFARDMEEILVIEENEPYLEKEIKALGIACRGRDVLPICGELNPETIREAFLGAEKKEMIPMESKSPTRPPVLCAGCPHRGFFNALKTDRDIIASGDIGCYTLGAMDPINVTDTVICMGASISAGTGMQKVLDLKGNTEKKVFSFIGDSTFFHSGITGLVNSIYNKVPVVTVIMDNRTTGMTGHQENPGTGKTLMGEEAGDINIPMLVRSLGIKDENIKIINPYYQDKAKEVVNEAKAATEPFVIITQEPCALLKDVQILRRNSYVEIDQEKCRKCKTCVRTGCPAIYIKDGSVFIDREMCNGCTLCYQVCPFDAIEKKGDLVHA